MQSEIVAQLALQILPASILTVGVPDSSCATPSSNLFGGVLYGHALAISPNGLIAGFEYNPATDRVEAALWRVSVVLGSAP